MLAVEVLDCTLRDGGYVNNWAFGKKHISMISKNLSQSSIEYIEGGFLSQTKECNEDQSIFPTIEAAEKYFSGCNNNIALMINCGEYDADSIPMYGNGKISTLRIAFHKHQRKEAQELCVSLKNKGYNVFFQPMVTIGYNDKELLSLIDWANEYSPKAFYIVDSFGTMRRSDVLRIFYLIDNNLNKDIKIGFHSHNNLQLSFSNAQELIQMNTKRDLIIDSSIFGMGRGAGNLCTELITQYINENIGKKYDILPVLEAMDEYIMPIYSQHPWGYSAPYYIAAINNCHPNYATFLLNKRTLTINEIDLILKNLPLEKRDIYDKALIEQMYHSFQNHQVDDQNSIEELEKAFANRTILILAPGHSIIEYKAEIDEFIRENDPIVVTINGRYAGYKSDFVFVSNLKRMYNLDTEDLSGQIILTSNLPTIVSNGIYVDYSGLCDLRFEESDNSGLMLIRLLIKTKADKLFIAGFDGFSKDSRQNYYHEKMINSINPEGTDTKNDSIRRQVDLLKKEIDITTLTPSKYF